MVTCSESNGGVTFTVRVIPRSSKTEIVGEHDGVLKVKLRSPPVDGAANDELVRFLSKSLGVSRANVEIDSGQAARVKRIRVHKFTAAEVTAILQPKM